MKLEAPVAPKLGLPTRTFQFQNQIKARYRTKKTKKRNESGTDETQLVHPLSAWCKTNDWERHPDRWSVIVQRGTVPLLVDRYTELLLSAGNYTTTASKAGGILSVQVVRCSGDAVRMPAQCHWCGRSEPPLCCPSCRFARWCTETCAASHHATEHAEICEKLRGMSVIEICEPDETKEREETEKKSAERVD